MIQLLARNAAICYFIRCNDIPVMHHTSVVVLESISSETKRKGWMGYSRNNLVTPNSSSPAFSPSSQSLPSPSNGKRQRVETWLHPCAPRISPTGQFLPLRRGESRLFDLFLRTYPLFLPSMSGTWPYRNSPPSEYHRPAVWQPSRQLFGYLAMNCNRRV